MHGDKPFISCRDCSVSKNRFLFLFKEHLNVKNTYLDF